MQVLAAVISQEDSSCTLPPGLLSKTPLFKVPKKKFAQQQERVAGLEARLASTRSSRDAQLRCMNFEPQKYQVHIL